METLSDLQTVTEREIAAFVDCKDITLVGNGTPRGEPKGVVVRMNQGISDGHTDVWINNLIRRQPVAAKCQYIMRMNAEKGGDRLHEEYPEEWGDRTYFWNSEEYDRAAHIVGYCHPMTGTMALWWFIHKTKAKIHLSGYDFFHGRQVAKVHEPEKDEAFVRKMVWYHRAQWLVPDITEYFNANRAPETVVVLGKGPSLDRYKPGQFGDAYVVGLNETMEQIPCDMGVYIDDRQRELSIPGGVVIVRPVNRSYHHDGRGYIYDRMRGYDNGHTKATAAMAITMLHMWGVKKLILVGFDSFDGPTEKIKADCVRAIAERGNSDYSIINKSIRQALDYTGFEPVWFHRSGE